MRITAKTLHDQIERYNWKRHEENRIQLTGYCADRPRWCLYTSQGLEISRWISTTEMYEVLRTMFRMESTLKRNREIVDRLAKMKETRRELEAMVDAESLAA